MRKTAFAGQLMAFTALVAVGVAGRLLPHPPNFTPVAAAALFAGYFFRNGVFALMVPLVTMVVSDALIGGYEIGIMFAVYGGMTFPAVFRLWLRRRCTASRVAVGAVGSSVAFFTLSNFAVWWFGSMYNETLTGLLECYFAALPFLKFTLAGDLCWSAGLFGGYALGCQLHAASLRPIFASARLRLPLTDAADQR